jgi:hypothetical protein
VNKRVGMALPKERNHMRSIALFILLSIIGFVSGCATSYRMDYHTCLFGSEPKSLQFKDDKFTFEFTPVPNGVWFKIENLSGVSGFLVWDRCYFIEPGGNSSKALNVDLLEENTATRDKAVYESILPPNAIFARFTTSALNIEEFSALRSSQITNYFLRMSSSFVEMNKFYNFGRYWPEFLPVYWDSTRRAETRASLSLSERTYTDISSYLASNDRMGLGLCIRLNESFYDYRFDFLFEKIEVFKIRGKKAKLIGSASKADSWNWIHVK